MYFWQVLSINVSTFKKKVLNLLNFRDTIPNKNLFKVF